MYPLTGYQLVHPEQVLIFSHGKLMNEKSVRLSYSSGNLYDHSPGCMNMSSQLSPAGSAARPSAALPSTTLPSTTLPSAALPFAALPSATLRLASRTRWPHNHLGI